MEYCWVAMVKGKTALEDLPLASKYSDLKVTHMPSIHNTLAGNNLIPPPKQKWPGKFTPDPRKHNAKYLKTNINNFRIAIEQLYSKILRGLVGCGLLQRSRNRVLFVLRIKRALQFLEFMWVLTL